MFKKNYAFLIMVLFTSLSSCLAHTLAEGGEADALPQKNVNVDNYHLPIADPYVLSYQGKYYAYGTGTFEIDKGFSVFCSDDLKYWKNEGRALAAVNSYGTWGFWAPEVYYVESQKKFYMFYSSAEHICVATSNSPTGPFLQDAKQPIWDEKSIDSSLFIDDDGTPYLYFVRFTNGNVVWVAEMEPDLKSIKKETLKECIVAEQPWELIMNKIAEGPSILKRDGVYYLIYSANHYQSRKYGVGYATSSSPVGPWKKYSGNPIVQGDDAAGLVGTGHGAPFICREGGYKYIFHAHWNGDEIHPRVSYIKDLIFTKEGVISINGDLIRPVVVK